MSSSSSSGVKDLLNQEQFKSIREFFGSWSEDALAAVDKSQFASMFGARHEEIAIAHKFYKAVQALLKPEPKLILLHQYGLDSEDPAAADSEEAEPPKEVLVMDAADLTQLFAALGAFGLLPRSNPQKVIRSFDALEPGAEYWPSFSKGSRLSDLEQEATHRKGFRRHTTDAWEAKVNTGLPALLAPEGLQLELVDIKTTQAPLKRGIDGLFVDMEKKTTVIVQLEPKSAGAMELTDKDTTAELDEYIAALQNEDEALKLAKQKANKLKDAAKKYADLQLWLTVKALRESTGHVRRYADRTWDIVMVLAPQHLSAQTERKIATKRGPFRFIRPDNSGLYLT